MSLADKFYDEIAAAGLKRSEAVGVVSELLSKLMSESSDRTITNPEPPTPPPRSSSISYDPQYDPPPPFEPDHPPPREEATGNKVLAAIGTACICSACKKVAYVTNREIRDKMKVVDFIAAFTPGTGVPELSKKAEIQNIDGNIATDCPACQGMKTLYLTGGPIV